VDNVVENLVRRSRKARKSGPQPPMLNN
jgi:hypothetical protein